MLLFKTVYNRSSPTYFPNFKKTDTCYNSGRTYLQVCSECFRTDLKQNLNVKITKIENCP